MDLEKDSEENQDYSEVENDLNFININPVSKKVLLDETTSKGVEENELEKQFSYEKETEEKENSSTEPILNETRSSQVINSEHEPEEIQEEDEDNIKVKPKKRMAIIDSDSEEELNTKQSDSNIESDRQSESDVTAEENQKTELINLQETTENNDKVMLTKKSKRIAFIDSDSDDEAPVTPHNKSFNDELEIPQGNKDTSVYVINKNGNLVAENNPEISQEDIIKKSRFAALCDSESSEEENRYPISLDSPLEIPKRAKVVRKSTPKASTEKPSGKKMTAKQALEQRQEIRSESQRMLRESRLSLPYHKPKTRSIREFLQNRPRFSLSIKTENTLPSMAMKMSVQELEIVTKKLEERGKAVQEFFKSESESEDEETEDSKIDEENKEIIENNQGRNEETEKIENEEAVTEDKESLEIYSESKEEENRKEMQDLSNELSIENNSDSFRMQVDLGIPEVDSGVSENITMDEERSLVTEETVDANVPDEMKSLNKNGDGLEVPEQTSIELENNKSNICEDEADTTPVQERSTSLNEPETALINPTENRQEMEESNNQPTAVIEQFDDSVDFDFNLDGLEEDIENAEILERISDLNKRPEDDENNSKPKEEDSEYQDQHLQRLLKKYEDNPTDDILKSVSNKKINRADLLKQIGSTKPSLSGRPDEVIDLDAGITKPSEVAQLMERFMKHALAKNVVKHNVKLDVINFTQGEVIKETVAMSVDPEEEPIAILEKPGIKLKKLRDELQSQMAQRRSELWLQKHQPLDETLNKDPYEDEKSDCGDEEDILDDEEAELTDIEDEEEEDEYEEEVRKTLEKPKVKSAFIEDEAEETDEDDCEEEKNEEVEESEEIVEEDTNEDQITTIKKPLRRILKGFTEDSDEEDCGSQFSIDPSEKNKTENKNTSFNSFNTTDSYEETVPPNQPRTNETPCKDMTQSKTAIFGLLTPVQHLTGLQGFNSESKFLHEESPVSPFRLPPDPSPFKDKNWNTDLQKKLFSDSNDAFDSEGNMEDLAQLCSGKFPTQTQTLLISDSTCSSNLVENLATQDVLSMCSGSFPDLTMAAKDPQDDKVEVPLLINEENSDKTEVLNNKSVMHVNLNSNEEIKTLDDDKLISELLDEEEMEQFKKKFESPLAPISSNKIIELDSEMEVMGGGKFVSDSSDEEGEEPKNKKYTKKLQKRLAFSDDSDSEEEGNEEMEEINLHDDCSENQFDDDSNINKVVDYDSEENEIEFDNQEEAPKQKLKPSDFLENEAELSESDWDSADEDEKGLDALEFEQGDADVFDENKMRTDLEKIHMRRVLDQDNQEIKILQEMLLEDGELHGTGRQRQFRWRNIDETGNDEDGKNGEIEAFLDEEESEEQWRRARHQREMFLKDKQEKHSTLENDNFFTNDSNSQVLKLGQEAIRKSFSAGTVPENLQPTTSSPEIAKPLMLLNTRGSFLARTDKFLSKLAEFTKVSTTTNGGVQKTTKKIVFQSVSTKESGVMGNKRKLENEDKTPKIIKKLRLSSNLTPVLKNVDRKKKLF